MRRRWTKGALIAVVAAIVTATSVSGEADWAVRLGFTPFSIEFGDATPSVRVDLRF